MTTQEYVKKEASMNADTDNYDAYADGLSAGIELAKECLDFAVNKFFSVERLDGKTYWAKSGQTGSIQYLTTSELFEIFLTERNV